jgi:hypothetical protein
MTVGIIEQMCKSAPNPLGFGKGALPFVIQMFGGIVPGLLLPVQTAIRPCLVRVTGEQKPFTHAEFAVMSGQRVGRTIQRFGRNH